MWQNLLGPGKRGVSSLRWRTFGTGVTLRPARLRPVNLLPAPGGFYHDADHADPP